MVLSLLLAGLVAAPVAAEPRQVSVTQELHVTAKVAPKRRIVIDASGRITQIISNTTEDVLPDVFLYDIAPRNRQELTDRLYEEYRSHVPEGTAKYGILYDRADPTTGDIASILLRPDGPFTNRS